MSAKINSSVTLHQGRVFTLLKENITLGNGVTIDLDIIRLATDLVPDKQNLDKDEMLDVHEIGLADATKMIYNGSIQDGKTISGIFMATLWLKDNRLVTE